MASPSTFDPVRKHARALSDPSRFRIFAYIADSDKPVAVAELTELLGFNHNAIRQHLAVLVDAEIVVEEREVRNRPGRPRLLYSAREDALRSFGDSSRSYRRLAGLLLEVALSGDSAYAVGRRAAIEQRVDGDVVASAASLVKQLAVEGFEPLRKGRKIVLQNCPFADVATNGTSVVCELHRGLIDGHLGDGNESELRIREPHRAGCQVMLASGVAS